MPHLPLPPPPSDDQDSQRWHHRASRWLRRLTLRHWPPARTRYILALLRWKGQLTSLELTLVSRGLFSVEQSKRHLARLLRCGLVIAHRPQSLDPGYRLSITGLLAGSSSPLTNSQGDSIRPRDTKALAELRAADRLLCRYADLTNALVKEDYLAGARALDQLPFLVIPVHGLYNLATSPTCPPELRADGRIDNTVRRLAHKLVSDREIHHLLLKFNPRNPH